jgi:hypothetical protein
VGIIQISIRRLAPGQGKNNGSSPITGEGTRNKSDGTTANSQQETPNFQVTANGSGNGLTTLPSLYPRVSLRLRVLRLQSGSTTGQAMDKSRCR